MDLIHLKKRQAKRMDMKTGSSLLLYTRNTPNLKDRHYLRIKKIFQSNGSKLQEGVAILISNKIDFKLKSIKRYGEGYYTLKKVTPSR